MSPQNLTSQTIPLHTSSPRKAYIGATMLACCLSATSPAFAAIDTALFSADAAQCAQLTVKYRPDNLAAGPFCPATVSDTGGIREWDGEKAGLYRINEDYLQMLDENAEITMLVPTNAQASGGAPRTDSKQSRPDRSGAPGGPGQGTPQGLEEAAQQLGVTTEALMNAMQAAGGRSADLGAVAARLGVPEDALRAVLPPPSNR